MRKGARRSHVSESGSFHRSDGDRRRGVERGSHVSASGSFHRSDGDRRRGGVKRFMEEEEDGGRACRLWSRPSTDGAEAAARSYPKYGIMSTGAAGDVAIGWFLDHAWLACYT